MAILGACFCFSWLANIANATALAADRPANETAAAEIPLPKPSLGYPHPFIYASNRNIGGTADLRGTPSPSSTPRGYGS
jgi:hypothetical protein